MSEPLVVHLIGEPLGEPVLGLWCDDCQSSSGYALPIRITTDQGWLLSLTIASGCSRCEEAS